MGRRNIIRVERTQSFHDQPGYSGWKTLAKGRATMIKNFVFTGKPHQIIGITKGNKKVLAKGIAQTNRGEANK